MKKLVALFAASIVTVMAYSATLNYTNSYSGYADYVQDIPIPQFNPVLGSLRSVIVQAQYIENKSMAMENQSAGDQSTAMQIINTINVSIPYSSDASTNTYTSNAMTRRLVRSYDGVTDFAGASGYTVNSLTTNAMAIALTNITRFNGYSVIPVRTSVVGKSYWSITGGSYASYTQDVVEVRIFVQYIYDPYVVVCYDNRKFKKLV